MEKLFGGIYYNRRVLITGHTGFKGSWLAYWLNKMGAQVIGFSLEAPTQPNHFNYIKDNIHSEIFDIREISELRNVFAKFQPEIVFHLAAQPLVKLSYDDPLTTYEVNVMGTLNVLQVSRETPSVNVIVNITSDKCYENKEWIWGYRENDELGGYDPYSSSKACSELVTSAYRNSFLNIKDFGKSHHILLASARAGNVIGGGDWAKDRLIPDLIKNITKGEKTEIRNLFSSRPWQHVLEPLSGYLLLGWRLLEGESKFATSWNFGPIDKSSATVKEVIELATEFWDKVQVEYPTHLSNVHEANNLSLDCTKALTNLRWENVWDLRNSVERTINWYKSFYTNGKINTIDDLSEFVELGTEKGLVWT